MACRVTIIRRPSGVRGAGGPRIRRRILPLALVSATIAPAVGVEILPATPPAPVAVPDAAVTAASVPPAVVAEFTRRMQPLVLNRCASGACHGDPRGPEPRFIRPLPHGGIDRAGTQANLRAFLAAVGPERDGGRLAALLAAGHPAKPASPRLVASPLSPGERTNLEHWLASVRHAERGRFTDPAVQPAAATVPARPPAAPPTRTPNPFRALLDDAANPPELPPPQEPQGVIFPRDVPADDPAP